MKKTKLLVAGLCLFSSLLAVTPSVSFSQNAGVVEAATQKGYIYKKYSKGAKVPNKVKMLVTIRGKQTMRTCYLMSWNASSRTAKYYYYI
ncbi:bacteriocin 32 [Enterococcus hirae]|uniref:bacteriocin 32 n=1 Tax=Enterococcus sp. AZ137 TaxID=2774965 RepID=UPI003636A8FE